MNRTITLLAASSLAVSVELAASADPSTADASKLLHEANDAAAKKDWATCIAKAKAGWEMFQTAQGLGLQGYCEVKSGAYKDGVTHLSFYAKTSTSGIEGEMAAALKEGKEYVAEVAITSDPDGASIRVDEADAGRAPVVVFLGPGKHTLEAQAKGRNSTKESFDAVAGTKVEHPIRLELSVVAPPPASRPLWPGILGAALGGGALVAGFVTMGISFDASSEASTANASLGRNCSGASPSPACTTAFDAQDRATTTANLSFATLLSAGLLAGFAIPYLAWASGGAQPPNAETPQTTVTPWLSPSLVGVGITVVH